MSFCLVQGQESASDVHVSFDDRPAGEGVTERDERDERDERAALTTRYKMPREPPKEKNLDVSTTRITNRAEPYEHNRTEPNRTELNEPGRTTKEAHVRVCMQGPKATTYHGT